MKRKLLIGVCLTAFINGKSQTWLGGGNPGIGPPPIVITAANNILGTVAGNNVGIRFNTNGVQKCDITTNAPLNNNIFSSANGNFSGDGIRIAPGVGSAVFATLDLFTTASNQTHIRMDGTALIQTASSRFEQYANLNGFWLNATGNSQFGVPGAFTPQFIFNITSTEKGRLGSNGWWRLGNNPGLAPINANNILEITTNGAATAPYFGTVNGSSGLRLRNLTSANTPLANGVNGVNNQKLLTVDQNGDVVLTNGANQFGGICGSNANALTSNWELPMNNFNFIFGGQSSTADRVGIGTVCIPIAKLEVLNSTPWTTTISRAAKISNLSTSPINVGMELEASGGIQNYGLLMKVNNSTSGAATSLNSSAGIGLQMTGNGNRCVGISSSIFAQNLAIGGVFNVNALSNKNIIGIQASATGAFNNGTNAHTGFVANASGAFSNHGILAYSGNSGLGTFPGNSNISVYGQCNNGIFNYSFYADAPSPNGTNTSNNNNYAGFFNGGVYSAQIILPSDELIKKDKNIITDAITKLAQLDPISFQFDTTVANPKGLSLPGGLQYGFKAQQVETVYPELVTMIHKPEQIDTAGNVLKPSYDFKGINYMGFIALLTKAVQQQQTKIDSLTTKTTKQDSINNSLQSQINSIISTFSACCSSAGIRNTGVTGNNINQLNIELSNAEVIILNQNSPNPFAEQTTITYNVPAKYSFAQMVFKTIDGKIIRTVDITTKGRGQLNVFANDLTSGLYMYSLIVDGKLIDSKKMVKE